MGKESIKGKQFISVAVEFRRPESYKGSLPEFFIVKRTWHRDNRLQPEQNNLESKGATYTGDLVTQDGNIITGKGPEAAEKFGNTIAQALSK